MKYRLALLALLLLASTSADGQNLVKVLCYSAAVAEEAANKAAASESQDLIDIDGPAAQRYLDIINADPPITSMKAARVILVPHHEGGPTLVIFLQSARAGCVVGRVKLDLHIRALQASKETPA